MGESLEALARTWLETKSPDDQLRYLLAQRELGVLRRTSVESAAWLGDAVACRLLGERAKALRPPGGLRGFLDLLPGDKGVKGRAAAAILRLLEQRAAAQAGEHPVGQKVLRALDCPDPPSIERMLTAHAAPKRSVDALWRDVVGLAQDCMQSQDDLVALRAAIQEALYPWVLVRPDPGGAPLEEAKPTHPLLDPAVMTLEAARAVLCVPAGYPIEDPVSKELIRDYFVAIGWSREVGGLVAPAKDLRLKFDMSKRRLVLYTANNAGSWDEAGGAQLPFLEVAGRLVQNAEDALRVAGEQHPTKRKPRARRRRPGEKRSASWTLGGDPTLVQIDQIAELMRGLSDAEFHKILLEVADVESVGHLGRETAGKLILVLSGFG